MLEWEVAPPFVPQLTLENRSGYSPELRCSSLATLKYSGLNLNPSSFQCQSQNNSKPYL